MPNLTIAEYEAKATARFWRKVNKTDTCWLWTGTLTSYNYGRHSMTPPGGKHYDVSAHRYSWALENGPIPKGIEIDHQCHTPLCVNPAHLRSATRKQNSENRQGATWSNKSGVRGVSWDPHANKWKARVGHNKTDIHVGLFHNLAEAEAAVTAKRLELHTHNAVDRTEPTR